jgi:glutamate-ammonia-ligase adenylyltransferase
MTDNLQLYNSIHTCDPWEESFEKSLREYNFIEPKKAWKNILTLSSQANFEGLFPGFFKLFIKTIGSSYHPDLALNNFERFTETIEDKNYLYTILNNSKETLKSLVVLFSGSQILTDTLLSNPSFFEWINNSEIINKPRSKDEFMRAY